MRTFNKILQLGVVASTILSASCDRLTETQGEVNGSVCEILDPRVETSVRFIDRPNRTLRETLYLPETDPENARWYRVGNELMWHEDGVLFDCNQIDALLSAGYDSGGLLSFVTQSDDFSLSDYERYRPRAQSPEISEVSSAELIREHNNGEVPVRGGESYRNIFNPNSDLDDTLRFPSSRSSRENARWYRFGSNLKWYEDGMQLSRTHVNFLLRTGYDPAIHTDGIREYINSRLVTVQFFNESYRVDPMFAALIQEVYAELTDEDVEYVIENLHRGNGFEWRGVGGSLRLSNHGLGLAIDIDPGNNCWHSEACRRGPITPIYARTDYRESGGSGRYSAPSQEMFMESFWNRNARIPLEWGMDGSRAVSLTRRNFEDLFNTYFEDGENDDVITDWMHFNLEVSRDGKILLRSTDRNGETLSFPHISAR